MQGSGIGKDVPGFRREVCFHLDVCGNKGPEHVNGFFQHRFALDNCLSAFLAAAEGQELGYQVFCPFSCLQNLGKILSKILDLILLYLDQAKFGKTHDCSQDVVEIMGNTSGKCSQCLHFSCLNKLLFHIFFPGYIAGDIDNAGNFSLLVVDGERGGKKEFVKFGGMDLIT